MRCSCSTVSTVANKLAKGPVGISTLSPSLRLMRGSETPEASHLSIKPEIKSRGPRLWFALKAHKSLLTNRTDDRAPGGQAQNLH